MANVFSVVALLIMFREALEASIIISVMLQLCDRLKLQPMKKVGAPEHIGPSVGLSSLSPLMLDIVSGMQCG